MPATDHIELAIGPARIRLRPLEPFAWQPRAEAHPGPAGLCLELLELAEIRWSGLAPACPPPDREHLSALPAGLCGRLLAALRAPWLTASEAEGLSRLRAHAAALADYPALDCGACRAQEQRGEGPPDCAACPIAGPPPEARLALNLHRWLVGGPAGRLLLDAATRGLTSRQARLLAMRLGLLEAARLRAEADRRLAGPPGA